MSLKNTLRKIWSKMTTHLSLQRRKDFIPNLVLALGVVFFRRGVWNILDAYLFPQSPMISYILSIVIGILLVYLPDGTLMQLGGGTKPKEKNKVR